MRIVIMAIGYCGSIIFYMLSWHIGNKIDYELDTAVTDKDLNIRYMKQLTAAYTICGIIFLLFFLCGLIGTFLALLPEICKFL